MLNTPQDLNATNTDLTHLGVISASSNMSTGSLDGVLEQSYSVNGVLSSGFIMTNNYNLLINKPKINDVELIGNLTLNELGIQEEGDYATNTHVKTLIEQKTQTYIHEQNIVSDSWLIEHNLNKYPSVIVVDSAMSMIMGEITYIDENNLRIDFNGAFIGKAFLN